MEKRNTKAVYRRLAFRSLVRDIPGSIRLLIFLCGLSLLFCAGAVAVILLTPPFSSVYNTETELESKPHLNVTTRNIPVTITADGENTRTGKITVSYYNETDLLILEEDYVTWLSENEDFSVSVKPYPFGYRMEITVPDTPYIALNVTSLSGDITVSGVSARTVTAASKSGNISVSDITGGVKITGGSGGVTADFKKLLNPVIITTTTGNVTANVAAGQKFLLGFYSAEGELKTDYRFFSGEEPATDFSVRTETGNLNLMTK